MLIKLPLSRGKLRWFYSSIYYWPIIHCQASRQAWPINSLLPHFQLYKTTVIFIFFLCVILWKRSHLFLLGDSLWKEKKMGRRPGTQNRRGKTSTSMVKHSSVLLKNLWVFSWFLFIYIYLFYFGSCLGQWLIVFCGQLFVVMGDFDDGVSKRRWLCLYFIIFTMIMTFDVVGPFLVLALTRIYFNCQKNMDSLRLLFLLME